MCCRKPPILEARGEKNDRGNPRVCRPRHNTRPEVRIGGPSVKLERGAALTGQVKSMGDLLAYAVMKMGILCCGIRSRRQRTRALGELGGPTARATSRPSREARPTRMASVECLKSVGRPAGHPRRVLVPGRLYGKTKATGCGQSPSCSRNSPCCRCSISSTGHCIWVVSVPCRHRTIHACPMVRPCKQDVIPVDHHGACVRRHGE